MLLVIKPFVITLMVNLEIYHKRVKRVIRNIYISTRWKIYIIRIITLHPATTIRSAGPRNSGKYNYQCKDEKDGNGLSTLLRCLLFSSDVTYRNQNNGQQHHRNMLNKKESRDLIINCSPAENNFWTDEIQDETKKQLGVSRDKCKKSQLFVFFPKWFFTHPFYQSENNAQNKK